MKHSSLFSLYGRLPVWLQNCACSVSGLQMRRQRYNQVFWNALEFLETSQWWSYQELLNYQNAKLRAMVQHAYDNVRYYRETLAAIKITPKDIQSVEDLHKLPLLEKHTVRDRFHDLTAANWPGHRLLANKTGGTTGTALKLLDDTDTVAWQWAVWWRHRRRFGLNVHDPFVVFAGRDVVPLSSMNTPFWRRNLPMHQTYVSIHHMTRQNMPALVDYLQTREVAFYSGYPSGLYLLARHLLEHGISLAQPPRITTTGAETLLPHQREAIRSALRTEVTDQYGASEHCGNISECEAHRYHVDMEFGVVEFLPIPGLPNNVRRIVCTGLHNPAMPLIRYVIGDVATVSTEDCSCGRNSPVVEAIDGRIESYIITPDGRQLGRLDFLFKETRNILEAQLVQHELDRVIVRIIKESSYSSKDEQELMVHMRQYLGDVIRIDMDYVKDIPREANGKFRQIVSHIFNQYSSIVASKS